MRKLVVAVALGLGLPSGAQAADYMVLDVTPTKVAPVWTLGGSVASGSFYHGTDDVFGLTLRRGACVTTATFGNVSGTLTTTFAGWGTRIAGLETSDGVFRATR